LLFLLSVAAVSWVRQGPFELQIKAIAQKRAAFQAMKPVKAMFGGDAGTAFFFPAGHADCRYIYGASEDMSDLLLIKETLVGGRPKQSWSLKLIEKPVKGKAKPGELNLYLRNVGLVPKGPVSNEMAKDLSSPLPLAAYNSSGPTEILFSYFIIGGKLLGEEPTDTQGAVNKARLRLSYPVPTLERAWLKTHGRGSFKVAPAVNPVGAVDVR